jgi:hypothetical protein
VVTIRNWLFDSMCAPQLGQKLAPSGTEFAHFGQFKGDTTLLVVWVP